tara:strand:+ start:1953 stop:2150 length:198 start_codon:yes stop_codon:yes gene_type:complete
MFILQAVLAGMAEWSKAADLRSAGGNSAWVRTPLPATLPIYSNGKITAYFNAVDQGSIPCFGYQV